MEKSFTKMNKILVVCLLVFFFSAASFVNAQNATLSASATLGSGINSLAAGPANVFGSGNSQITISRFAATINSKDRSAGTTTSTCYASGAKVYMISIGGSGQIKVDLPSTGDYYLDKIRIYLTTNSSSTGSNTAWSHYRFIQSDGTTYSASANISGTLQNYDAGCIGAGNYIDMTAPDGAKTLVFGRGSIGGTSVSGSEFRIYCIEVWIKQVISCTSPDSKTVSGLTTICSGSSTDVTLASSQSGVTYQLYAGASASGTAVEGTGNDLIWSVSPTSTTTYTVKTTTAGGYCETTMNGSAEITVNASTAISSQSTAAASYGQNFGSPTALTVSATGSGLSYQWYKSMDAATNTAGDDTEVGTNSNSYAPSTTTMGTSYYYCVVTGSCGTATSAVSGAIEIIEACTAPTFSTQPTDNQTECVGGSLTLVTVAADQSATYQWYLVGTKTNTGGTTVGSSNGGNTATFTPSSATAGTFYYYCVATSGACYTSSNAVQITVYPTNPIVSQSTAAANYSVNATATALSVTTSGTGLSFQWYSNTTASNTGGSIINDATSSSFTPPTTSLGTTYYYCVVSGGCSTPVTSNVSGAIAVVKYQVGDFRSKASGTWATYATVWETFNGTTWSTAAAVPTTTNNVWIEDGSVIQAAAAGNCKNLYIINGQLLKSTTIGSVNSTVAITVAGTTVEVDANGRIGNDQTGNNADGISLTLTNTGIITITGSGPINVSKLALSGAGGTLNIDADITVRYHGSSNGGNAYSIYPTVTPYTVNINASKTLTAAEWSCIYLNTSSTALQSYDFTLNVNGTLNMLPGSPTDVNDRSLAKSHFMMNVATTKTFTVNIGSTGTMTVNEFYPNVNNSFPNGTANTNAVGTSVVTVANGGILNIRLLADFSQNASQIITGLGTVNILAGCEVKVANTAGINGHIQTSNVSIDEDAKFSFFGSEAQVSGSMFANANTVTVNNTAGLTISENSNIDNLTIASGAKLNIAAGKQLTLGTAFANNGTIHLKSDASGTATVLLPSNVSGTGAAIAEQYLATTRNWYISSPVSNAVAPAGYTYYQRDEAGSSWTSRPFVADSTFVRGRGYIALPGSEAAVITFSAETGGSLNTGDIPVYLTFAGTSSKGYNLIGNPYPSHLTWTKTFVDNNASLIEPSIYYRTTTGTANNQTGWSFKTINASTGEVSPSGTSNTIPPMQAFWIRAKASGVLTLNSDLTKSHNASNPLKVPATKNADRQRLRLQVNNGTATDEAVLYFDAAASDAYDRYDSPKFNEANTVTQIYTTAGTEKLVINGMHSLPLNQEIGLGFVPGSASAFSLRATELTNIPSDVRVILKDNVSKAETDLTDGVSVYEFAPATTTDNRFSVIFRTAGVTTGFEKSIVPKAYVYVNANNQITINASEKSNYSIYNAVGQLIENGILTSNTQTSNFKPTVGMYVVKVDNQSIRVIIK